ncbi:MAG: Mbeg1-like protein [Candidatus Limivicinus sp.]
MDNLSDYVQWMADFPISMTGFRDEDALILCALSYFDLTPVFCSAPACPRVRDCRKMLEDGAVRVMTTGSDKGFSELLGCAVNSKRFGDLRISDYVDTVRHDPPLQFSALCFHDDADFSFIAFRGTDSSLAAWKEDCMISFTRTEAQELALRYVEERIRPGRRWMIGGHSKGGNLALYASCLLSDEKWDCISHLYLLDCPGFCPDVLDRSLEERIDPRSTRIIPEFCIIGNLFHPKSTDTRVVQSFAANFAQHPLITWGIDHGKLALAKAQDPESLLLSESVNYWVSQISQADRIVFTDELFDALTAGGAVTIEDIQEGGLESLDAILRQFFDSSSVLKDALSDLPRHTWKIHMDALRKRLSTGWDAMRKTQSQQS